MTTIADILNDIEAARRSGGLGNDAARAASVALGFDDGDAALAVVLLERHIAGVNGDGAAPVARGLIATVRRTGAVRRFQARAACIALGLTGDDALLACRLIAQGSDPASIELLATGRITDAIRLAHRQGPGSLTGADRDRWLFLAALSVDESKTSSLRERADQMTVAVERFRNLLPAERADLVAEKRAEIDGLTFKRAVIGGREMRVYSADLGFAAAYWAGEPCAAVAGTFNGAPYVAVGSNGTPLAELGIKPDKALGPFFGIINTVPAEVAA